MHQTIYSTIRSSELYFTHFSPTFKIVSQKKKKDQNNQKLKVKIIPKIAIVMNKKIT